MTVPADIIAHCNAHPYCKGCPLKTCTAPLVEPTDPRWQAWLDERTEKIREIYQEGVK